MTQTYHIYGPPGCGKTTRLSWDAEKAIKARGPENVLIASLTRAAASEIGSRGLDLPKENMGTLHALCYRAMQNPEIAESHIDDWNLTKSGARFPITPQSLKSRIDLGIDEPGGMEGDKMLNLMNMYRARMISKDNWMVDVREFAKYWNQWIEENGYVDFTGMIEWALENTYSAPGSPEVLIGDECQDWSKLEMTLFRDNWGSKAEIILLAGDPDQAIYDWRGADPGCFMNHPIPEENKRILNQSYRLPSSIHEYSQKLIKRIQKREEIDFKPRDITGQIDHWEIDHKEPELMVEYAKDLAEFDKTVMILASCAYMLKPLIAVLRAEAIPFCNPYRKENPSWNPLGRAAKKTMPVDRVLAFMRPHESFGESKREWDKEDLRKWMSALRSKDILARGTKTFLNDPAFSVPPNYEEFENLFADPKHAQEAMKLNLKWFQDSVMNKYEHPLRYPIKVFKRYGAVALLQKPKIILGTIHSVKGGQADNVIVIPDISYTGFEIAENNNGWDSITRLFYVAVTRAKERLFLCDPATRFYFEW